MGYSLRTTAKVNYRLGEYGEVYWEESRSDKPCRSMSYRNQQAISAEPRGILMNALRGSDTQVMHAGDSNERAMHASGDSDSDER